MVSHVVVPQKCRDVYTTGAMEVAGERHNSTVNSGFAVIFAYCQSKAAMVLFRRLSLCLDSFAFASPEATSFPGSFILGKTLWGGEMKDPGNEVAPEAAAGNVQKPDQKTAASFGKKSASQRVKTSHPHTENNQINSAN